MTGHASPADPRTFTAVADPLPPGTRVAVAVARWNEPVTRRMLAAAIDVLARAGVAAAAVEVAWVPGAFELPLAAERLAAPGRVAAVIWRGAVLGGETPHDQHNAPAAARGGGQVARA
ncbi:MAG: 6,7-dimethyl-8-ribityllumazine synthase, partial [Planctomycetia bacterium]